MTGRRPLRQPAPGPSAAPDDELLDHAHRLAAERAEAQRRLAVRRRRRQSLPAFVVGSATLAGVGVITSWVHARMPAAAGSQPAQPAAPPAAYASVDVGLAALDSQLTADEQAVRALLARTAAATSGAAPAGTLPAAGPLPALPPMPTVNIPAAPAPATHATTGASHATR